MLVAVAETATATGKEAGQTPVCSHGMGAGTINITDGAKQTQDVAGLSRDTTDTNGTVSKTPDVNALLAQQADLMNAAQAAGQVMAQGIGAYADMKRDAAANAVEAAANSNDPQALAAALADYANWREGGDSRAALQAGGGAVIGGLGGGVFGAFGGAAGAAISSKLADQTKAAADAVSDATGSSLIGNISGNILSGLAGGLVGGSAGAAMASGVNLYNQSMDTEAAAKDARVKGIVAQALGSPPDLDSFSVSTLIDQFVGQVKSGAQARMSESPIDLLAQGVANGLNAVVGTGGGKPPAASPGVVLADSVAGQAMNAVPGTPGYGPSTATLNSGNDANSESAGDSSGSSGKSRNKPPAPLPEADGLPHTIIERPGPDGQYTTYNSDGTSLQYRGSGQDHGGIPRPNVKETSANVAPDGTVFVGKGVVRPATPNEIPRGK